MPFFIPLIVGASVGGVVSVAMGGDFLRGAGMGLLTGGVGALAGGALAGAGAATTTATIGGQAVSVFGHELTKQALYSLAGAAIGGVMSGMSVAQQTKAERRMKQEQEAYARREKELREMEQRHSEEARRSLANFEEGSRRAEGRRDSVPLAGAHLPGHGRLPLAEHGVRGCLHTFVVGHGSHLPVQRELHLARHRTPGGPQGRRVRASGDGADLLR